MARGWESKSVEAQQDEAANRLLPEKPRLTREEAARQREQEGLKLAYRNVLNQLENCHADRHRIILEKALADLRKKMEVE